MSVTTVHSYMPTRHHTVAADTLNMITEPVRQHRNLLLHQRQVLARRELTTLKSAQHAVPRDGAKGPLVPTVRRSATPPRWMFAGDAAHIQETASTQSDFSSLDMSVDVGRQGRMNAAETSMCASECMMAEAGASSTCDDAHASVAQAQDAHNVLLGKLCKLRVADFPVDSHGLAMWPRADLPLGCRRSCKHSSMPAKRTCPESDSDSDSGDGELNEEGEFFWCVEQQRQKKRSRSICSP